MEIFIKRIDSSLPLPVYETSGSVGFDFLAREKITIAPQCIALIPANVIIKTPPGYVLIVASRSSTPRKKGLQLPHGIGVIDQDYCGDQDEILIQVYNFTNKEQCVERGEKIAQGLFIRVDTFEFKEVDNMNTKNRGGFGSTDIKVL